MNHRKLLSIGIIGAIAPLWAAAESLPVLKPLSSFATGIFDEGAAEIATFDPVTNRVFFMNGENRRIDVLDISDPARPEALEPLKFGTYGNEANSVACFRGLLAVAVEMDDRTHPGAILLYRTDGTFLYDFLAGSLPDAVEFSPDGKYIMAASEGEPSDDYQNDPEGSLTLIEIGGYEEDFENAPITQIRFNGLKKADLDSSVRVFGPNASIAQDLEPEFIAFSEDSGHAFVTLQENNALAKIDLETKSVVAVYGLGFKDHSKPGNGFDASDKSGQIEILPQPVKGMYQPDAIASLTVGGKEYLVTANEGDARDYEGFSEEARVADLKLDPAAFPDAATLQLPENLGRLKTTTTMGDTDQDGDFDEIYSYGARSFSVWDADGNLVFDSGDFIERTLAEMDPDHFNSNNDDNDSRKARSDDKGPEPEGVTVGWIDAKPYLFLGLERMGGIMVFGMSDPASPKFLSYLNPRNFEVPADSPEAGDIGPEGMTFVPAAESPSGKPLLIVANEVSGTVSIHEVLSE